MAAKAEEARATSDSVAFILFVYMYWVGSERCVCLKSEWWRRDISRPSNNGWEARVLLSNLSERVTRRGEGTEEAGVRHKADRDGWKVKRMGEKRRDETVRLGTCLYKPQSRG